jgi:Tfp pilus assembly protein PilP
MTKQRFITLVALLSFAQLAILTSRQIDDKNSDLQRLRDYTQSFASSVAKLFSNDTDSAPPSPSSRSSQIAASSPSRPGELAPTFLNDDATTVRAVPKLAATLPTKPSVPTPQKNATPRDPFVPFFAIRNNNQEDGAHPLTNYSLEDLRVSAIIGDSTGNRSASIEATDGKSFIVRVGARVGDHGGRVERITPTTIVIIEPRDSAVETGEATTKELSLKTYPTPHSGLAN